MIISISGTAGSGKSTLAEMLATALGWPRHYMGGLRREAARKRGMTLAEYNQLGETDPSTDMEVDEFQKELGEKEDNFVIEGRTSWHFIPHSLKIYLDVDESIGAERVLGELRAGDNRNEDNGITNIGEMIGSMQRRKASDNKRYMNYFGIEVYNPSNYDYVVDTSGMTPEDVLENVLKYVRQKLS